MFTRLVAYCRIHSQAMINDAFPFRFQGHVTSVIFASHNKDALRQRSDLDQFNICL